MDALAFILIAAGGYLIQRALIGRAGDIGQDTTDLIGSVSSGAYTDAADVFTREGTAVIGGTGSGEDTGAADGFRSIGGPRGLQLLAKARALGTGKPYVWGATGPGSYDCSGLVWRAMKELGIYTGMRFTTASFNAIAPKFASRVDAAEPGAVCNWAGTHIGIVVSKDRYFSALNRRYGIIESSLSGEISRHGTPTYWRIK